MKKILIVGMALVFACTAFGVKRDVAPDMVMFEGKGKLVFVNAAGIDDTQIKAAAETIGKIARGTLIHGLSNRCGKN